MWLTRDQTMKQRTKALIVRFKSCSAFQVAKHKLQIVFTSDTQLYKATPDKQVQQSDGVAGDYAEKNFVYMSEASFRSSSQKCKINIHLFFLYFYDYYMYFPDFICTSRRRLKFVLQNCQNHGKCPRISGTPLVHYLVNFK